MLRTFRWAAFLSAVFFTGLSSPSLAAGIAPSHQSDCELAANTFKAEHPNATFDDFIKAHFAPFGEARAPEPPPDYRDPHSGITFHVAADGRQITATDAQGQVLWVRDPFVDRTLCPYRDPHPSIFWIGAPGGDFGRHYLEPFKPLPDEEANARIFQILNNGMNPDYSRARGRPDRGDTFIGVNFTSSQFGYVDIRNGDFYDMGQN